MVAGDRRLRSLRRGRRILKDGVVGAVVEAGARTGDVAPADTAYVVLIGAVAVGNAGAGMVVEGIVFGLAASFFVLGLRPRLETVFSSVVLPFAGSFCCTSGISVSSGSGLTLILLDRFVSVGLEAGDGSASVTFVVPACRPLGTTWLATRLTGKALFGRSMIPF